MEQDCTSSQSTADETTCFQTTESTPFLKGTYVSEPEKTTGPAIKKRPKVNTETKKNATPKTKIKDSQAQQDRCTTWSYLFVHNQKVKSIEDQLKKDHITHFVHKTIRYVPRHRNRDSMREVETPSVSGLIFLQGHPDTLQHYLDEHLPSHKLCKNCSTGRVATIPCNQMEPFMRVAESEPERLRFLLRPFVYYSKNRTLLRIVSGQYAGLEGYVIRIARDRRLVMDVGGMAVAVAGVHAERFEEINKNATNKADREAFYHRNLHERNAFIDRYFHPVKTEQEVAAQRENIDILRLQTLVDVREKRLDIKDAFDTFYFIIEEIGYYYAPFIHYFKDNLRPIFDAGKQVMQEIVHIITHLDEGDLRQRCETENEALRNNYGYLFE